jgi:hypothetical protein
VKSAFSFLVNGYIVSLENGPDAVRNDTLFPLAVKIRLDQGDFSLSKIWREV